ncbi:MAG: transglycosylase domain-containing protein [Oscillospiraceae bacterium]
MRTIRASTGSSTMKACVKMFLGRKRGRRPGPSTQQLVANITGRDEVTVRRIAGGSFTQRVGAWKRSTLECSGSLQELVSQRHRALGENCEGVESASRKVYFGKSVSDSILRRSAPRSSALSNNPSIYDPYINPDKNKQRRDIILGQML